MVVDPASSNPALSNPASPSNPAPPANPETSPGSAASPGSARSPGSAPSPNWASSLGSAASLNPAWSISTGHLPPHPVHELAGLWLSTDAVQRAMQRTAELALRALPTACTASITVRQGGRVVLQVAADPLGRWLAALEEEFGDGPALQALGRGGTTSVPDLRLEHRWAGLPTEMVAAGILSVRAVGTAVPGAAAGIRAVLAVHSDLPHHLDDEPSRAGIDAVASTVRDWVSGMVSSVDRAGLLDDLRVELTDHRVIDQAVGIVMSTHRCPASEAHAFLRHSANTRRTTVRRVAQDLVDRIGAPFN